MANAKTEYGKHLKDRAIMHKDSKAAFSTETMEIKVKERGGTPPSMLLSREVPEAPKTAQATGPVLLLVHQNWMRRSYF